MGFLSDLSKTLFESKAPPTVSTTQSSTTTMPSWYTGGQQYLAEKGKDLAEKGPQYFNGQLVADFTPDQLASMGMTKDSLGVYKPGMDQAQKYLTEAGANFDPSELSTYMNPHQSSVIDQIATQGGKNLQEKLLSQVNPTFTSTGQFGGSRHGKFTQDAISQANQDILAEQNKALQSGFNTATDNIFKNKAQMESAGKGLGALSQMQQQSAGIDASNLAGVGALQQALEQKKLDASKGLFDENKAAAWEPLQNYSQLMSGVKAPTTTTQTGDSFAPAYQPSMFSNIMGIGSTIGGALMGAKFSRGGRVRKPGALRKYATGGFVEEEPLEVDVPPGGLQPIQYPAVVDQYTPRGLTPNKFKSSEEYHSGIKTRFDDLAKRKAGLDAARDNLLNQVPEEPNDKLAMTLMAFGSGLMKPTRTGGALEGVGQGIEAGLPHLSKYFDAQTERRRYPAEMGYRLGQESWNTDYQLNKDLNDQDTHLMDISARREDQGNQNIFTLDRDKNLGEQDIKKIDIQNQNQIERDAAAKEAQKELARLQAGLTAGNQGSLLASQQEAKAREVVDAAVAAVKGMNMDPSSPEGQAEVQKIIRANIVPKSTSGGEWVTVQLPNGTTAQKNTLTGKIEGVPGITDKAPTDGQSNSAGFYDRMIEANNTLEGVINEGYKPNLLDSAKSSVPFVGNAITPEKAQQFQRAQTDFITAILRKESGAAISASEFENEAKKYFPQPGDSPKVIEDKENARMIAIENMKRSAGGALKDQGMTESNRDSQSPKIQASPGQINAFMAATGGRRPKSQEEMNEFLAGWVKHNNQTKQPEQVTRTGRGGSAYALRNTGG